MVVRVVKNKVTILGVGCRSSGKNIKTFETQMNDNYDTGLQY